MQISLLRAKVHRAEITDANLFYEGSLTLDEDLMDAAGLVEYEKVHVVNVNNGARLETYLIKGKRGSHEVCLNGAAAAFQKVFSGTIPSPDCGDVTVVARAIGCGPA